jgi:hypothetical protein
LRAPSDEAFIFSVVDTNKLQITAYGEEAGSLISNQEKWKRIIENRQKVGRGISRFDRGVKSSP